MFAEQNRLEYYEASAKSGANLDLVFENMGSKLLERSLTNRRQNNKEKDSIRRGGKEIGPKTPSRFCC